MIRREMQAHLEDRRRHFQGLADSANTAEWRSVFTTYVEFYNDILAAVSARAVSSPVRTLPQGRPDDIGTRSSRLYRTDVPGSDFPPLRIQLRPAS